jgi:murein DD-endopeptidase MepM/ murein hydrolase activator NlpD
VEHAGGEYADYFHLQQGSVTVRTGEAVVRGQLLGRVGNSGASGSPHLHFEITIPLHGPDGKSEWLGVPFRWTDFSLVDVEGRACEIAVASARPQEGWTMVLPEPPP